MMKKLSLLFGHISTGRNLIILFLIFIITTNIIFPWSSQILNVPEDGVEKIDLQLFYTPEKLFSTMEAYGDQGRLAYALSHVTADLLFPLVYMLLFGAWITYSFRRLFAPGKRVQLLNLTPLALLVFDLLENTLLTILLLAFPARLITLAAVAGIITAIKWVLSGLTVGLSVFGLFALIYRRTILPKSSANESN